MMKLTHIDYRYRVLKALGSGTSGDIYEVEGPEGVVALKLLKSTVPGMTLEEQVTHFKFEFSLLKGLSHPHLIRLFDFGYDEKLARFYFTQELLSRSHLAGPENSDAIQLIETLGVYALQGLAYLHDHQVIHGDIKPENLLIYSEAAQNLNLKIIDFGLSSPGLALRGGTPSFMAPEKILRENTDSRSDLYSLGVVFYLWFTGKNPFVRPSVVETLQAHLRFTALPAIQINPKISPIWSELIQKLLHKNPSERIFSAEEALRFLEERGALPQSEHPPVLHLKEWVGRNELFLQGKKFLEDSAKFKRPQALLLIGEEIAESQALLGELKYEAQLQGVEVLFKDQEPGKKNAVYFLNAEELDGQLEIKLEQCLKKTSCLLAISRSQFSKLKLGDSIQPLMLRPLNLEELESYVQIVTRSSSVPRPFLEALMGYSGGSISLVNQALRFLFRDRRLVHSSGKWNLAIFKERGPALEALNLEEDSVGFQDPEKDWAWRAEAITHWVDERDYDKALQLVSDFEEKFLSKKNSSYWLKGECFEKRGWIYSRQGRNREAREQWEQGLFLLAERKAPLSFLLLRLKNFLAYLDVREGREKKALEALQESWHEMLTLSEAEQKKVRNNELGAAYMAVGDFQKAADFLQEYLNLAENFRDDFLSMKLAYQFAEALVKLRRYGEAKQKYHQAENLARQQKSWDYLLRAYNGLGNVASLEQIPMESLDFYQRSLALAEYNHDYLAAATVAQNRGVILGELSRFAEAERELNHSKRLISRCTPTVHSRYLMARNAFEMGDIYFRQKDWAKARSFYQETLSRVEEEESLKYFRFYPLAGFTKLALIEKKQDIYQQYWPELVQLAKSDSEKKMLQEISELRDRELFNPQQAAPVSLVPPLKSEAVSYPAQAIRSVLSINRALISEQNPQILFQKILEYACELSTAESALLLEVTGEDELVLRSAFNTSIDRGQQEMSQQIAREVLSLGKSIVTHNALGDEHFKNFESVIHWQLRSVACIPIKFHQKVLGLLYLTHRHKMDLFQDDILSLLEAFADQAGLALQNLKQVEVLKELNAQLAQKLNHAEAFIDDLQFKRKQQVKNPYPKILGQSDAIRDLLVKLDRVSDTNLSILILGETGTGKELIARAIHENSRRVKSPFVPINCGAIPDNLIESELFGYTAGAFTGASRDKKGLFEEAQGGTLFLDEVAELSLNLQVKLLRALQEKEIYRLGSSKAIPLDLRVVAASHRSIESWVSENKFREDLYYRLAQMILYIPPLRDRLEDLPFLTEHFCKAAGEELQLPAPPRFERELLQKMMQYSWPGNIRELENMVRTASAFSEQGVVRFSDVPDFLRARFAQGANQLEKKIAAARVSSEWKAPQSSAKSWKEWEALFIAQSLREHQMDFQKVAKALKVGIATVYLKVRQYQLKGNLEIYQNPPEEMPRDRDLSSFKNWVIEEAYRRLKSPQEVARELKVSMGTIYRYLKNLNLDV